MAERNPSTSISLIEQAQSKDSGAWMRLSQVYSPLVFSWSKRAGLQDEDAADIVQDVFKILLKSLDGFRRDRAGDTFRGWLWTITRNEIRNWFRKQKARPEKGEGGSDANHRIASIADWVNDDSDIGEISPHESAETLLMQRAAEAIQGDFEPHTWAAFWRATVEGHNSTDIANDLRMTTGAVRQAKFRVLARLREYLS